MIRNHKTSLAFAFSALAMTSMIALAPEVIAQEPITLKGHRTRAYALAISSDGKRLVSGGWDGDIKIWDIIGGRELSTIAAFRPADVFDFTHVRSLAFAQKTDWFAGGSAGRGGRITVWNEKGSELWTRNGRYSAGAKQLLFTPDGKTLISCETLGRKIDFWNARTGKLKRSLKGHGKRHFLLSMALSPDGKLLATSGTDDIILLWDVGTGKADQLKVSAEDVYSVAFSRDSSLLAASRWSGSILLWDVRKMSQHAILTLTKRSTHYVRFTPRDDILAAAGKHGVELWDVKAKRLLSTIKDARRPFVFSPDGKILVTATRESAIKLWKIKRQP